MKINTLSSRLSKGVGLPDHDIRHSFAVGIIRGHFCCGRDSGVVTDGLLRGHYLALFFDEQKNSLSGSHLRRPFEVLLDAQDFCVLRELYLHLGLVDFNVNTHKLPLLSLLRQSLHAVNAYRNYIITRTAVNSITHR